MYLGLSDVLEKKSVQRFNFFYWPINITENDKICPVYPDFLDRTSMKKTGHLTTLHIQVQLQNLEKKI